MDIAKDGFKVAADELVSKLAQTDDGRTLLEEWRVNPDLLRKTLADVLPSVRKDAQ